MPEQSNDYNVVVFGAGQVGKSSLVLRFVRGAFRDSYVPTIEDTYSQVISCNKQVQILDNIQHSTECFYNIFTLVQKSYKVTVTTCSNASCLRKRAGMKRIRSSSFW